MRNIICDNDEQEGSVRAADDHGDEEHAEQMDSMNKVSTISGVHDHSHQCHCSNTAVCLQDLQIYGTHKAEKTQSNHTVCNTVAAV